MALVPFPGSQTGALQVPPEDPDDLEGTGDLASGKMSFLEHLDELRKRIIRSVLSVFVGVALCVYWLEDIVRFLLTPAMSVIPEGGSLIMTQPGEGFYLRVKVALIAGAVIAAPFIMYQVWKFIAPGLYTNEKKFAIPFVLFSSLGFLGGGAFNHYIAYPAIMGFFAQFHAVDLRFMPTLNLVFGMYTNLLLGFGFVFQMPTIVFFLARMRLVTARWLISQSKIAFLLAVVAAAILTPGSGPVELAIFTAPIVVLYAISILIAWLVAPKREAEDQSAN